MNTINLIGSVLSIYLIPILFIIGLTITNVAIYLGFGLVMGLLITGITLIILSIILVIEQNKATQPPQQ